MAGTLPEQERTHSDGRISMGIALKWSGDEGDSYHEALRSMGGVVAIGGRGRLLLSSSSSRGLSGCQIVSGSDQTVSQGSRDARWWVGVA
jgi:hypothetical protein